VPYPGRDKLPIDANTWGYTWEPLTAGRVNSEGLVDDGLQVWKLGCRRGIDLLVGVEAIPDLGF
jgi:hypothetical protein